MVQDSSTKCLQRTFIYYLYTASIPVLHKAAAFFSVAMLNVFKYIILSY